jgi:hypothetical protein
LGQSHADEPSVVDDRLPHAGANGTCPGRDTTPRRAALNPIYKYPVVRSSGRFVEAAQLAHNSTQRVGEDTVPGRKMDYVFFSANHTPLRVGGTLTYEEPQAGRHKILKARTTLH